MTDEAAPSRPSSREASPVPTVRREAVSMPSKAARDASPSSAVHGGSDRDSDDGSSSQASYFNVGLPFVERPVDVGVRFYDYKSYMNRIQGQKDDFTIEVLTTKPNWFEEVQAEWEQRGVRDRGSGEETKTQETRSTPNPGLQLRLPKSSESCPDDAHIQRVRLRSRTLAYHLTSLSGWDSPHSGTSIQIFRPFRILEDTFEGMKAKLEEMEKDAEMEVEAVPETDVKDAQPGNVADEDSSNNQPESTEASAEQIPDHHSDVGTAGGQNLSAAGDEEDTRAASSFSPVDVMRSYIGFVEKYILPIKGRLREGKDKTRSRVRYDDIPYLFKPGELIYWPLENKPGQTLHRSATQSVWRMVSCTPHAEFSDWDSMKAGRTDRLTMLDVYCLDYTGEKVVPVWRTIDFAWFKGERTIGSLEAYPLKFQPNHESILEEYKASGENFRACVAGGFKHLYYSGWTFITDVDGEAAIDEKGGLIRHPEYVESEVIVDFKETLRSFPLWETRTGSRYIPSTPWPPAYCELSCYIWEEYSTDRHGKRRGRVYNTFNVPTANFLWEKDALGWVEQDHVLSKDVHPEDDDWSDENLALLPKRLFGYILRERRFARLDVASVDLSKKQRGATLDDVQMKDSRRRMIRSAVSTHFRGLQMEKRGANPMDLDVIRGKGKGLVILLHGAPGVGKTATAEAIAAENSKPLFPITCGDLGFSPGAVDKSLRDIFRYAHLWDCILLLDEADVFLTQRSRSGGNLERNALVGVFLRVLEYYSGVLFLTTNRVGALDEAFQSRVHLSLCYPPLSLSDTLQILQSNLNRLPRWENMADKTDPEGYLKVNDEAIRIFVKEQYRAYVKTSPHKKGPWNGRQIRNAVQIAAGLAFYDKEAEVKKKGRDDGFPAYLTDSHFDAVAKTTAEFEMYLKEAKAGDEAFLSRQRGERADHVHSRSRDFEHLQSFEDDSETANDSARSHRSSTPARRGGKRPSPTPRNQSDRSRNSVPRQSGGTGGRAYSSPSGGRGPRRPPGLLTPRQSHESRYDEYDEEQDEGVQEFSEENEEEVERNFHRSRNDPRSSKQSQAQFGRKGKQYVWGEQQ
ncbi:ATP-dependent zinc metalloprotease FtsH [Colletotrichum orbiculare MAFF 240422]|uniref:ATP-dependent zinc metalloprotease FtsH n=1 Tax=Colletotrichum orbiculare (strain 104-T / ATCC 96160 / CBS 514.97 / LARS 414 / MAFF 240422) TaxID=1213857 RepID=A0A484G1Y7_COLOR|nr:ATP-dependent zinc metalloprotease FtsH [Colletotrichum orbiculare MAFF 240422]